MKSSLKSVFSQCLLQKLKLEIFRLQVQIKYIHNVANILIITMNEIIK